MLVPVLCLLEAPVEQGMELVRRCPGVGQGEALDGGKVRDDKSALGRGGEEVVRHVVEVKALPGAEVQDWQRKVAEARVGKAGEDYLGLRDIEGQRVEVW